MSEARGVLGELIGGVPSIQSQGWTLIGTAAAVMVVGFLIWSPLGWLGLLATLTLVATFRDPDRVTPLRDGLVVAASDGQVIAIDKVRPPTELSVESREVVRIAAALSLFDVHVHRAPVAGRLAGSAYVPGAFLDPTSDKASEENERRAMAIAMPTGKTVCVVQIAGFIGRRISTFINEGDTMGVGQRMGMVGFGGRVDVYLPEGAVPQVSVGQTLVSGETVLADLKSEEPEREARRG